MTNDEAALFRAAMRGVTPMAQDRAETGRRPVDNARFALLRQRASHLPETWVSPALSDQFVVDVEAEERLYFASNGVQKSQMQRLVRGQLAFSGSLDLHGLTVERSREQLVGFIAEAQQLAVRCVRVVHGKASGALGKQALLKSRVNSWLRQHPEVLGFASCVPRHGGSGAVYVLLRNPGTDPSPLAEAGRAKSAVLR
ncbi:Smr/MutS family protein [Ventosimonas gracilis]|uniref:Smr/MutS family protein n=1 Tax=Ventosimonas gracilis TaxID=1680762 RepID=UPI0009A15B49|nr:Smr/MutS family protein [Ventosimonas gracilis]